MGWDKTDETYRGRARWKCRDCGALASFNVDCDPNLKKTPCYECRKRVDWKDRPFHFSIRKAKLEHPCTGVDFIETPDGTIEVHQNVPHKIEEGNWMFYLHRDEHENLYVCRTCATFALSKAVNGAIEPLLNRSGD